MRVRVAGKWYSMVVLRLSDWDELGRPKTATIGYDDSTFDLRDDKVSREFMTCLVPEEMTKTRTRGN